ncbi:MAG TPA: hypothetical protein VKV39_17000 [Candidatus Sulfotelmatobacter sp.]|nr:hypothetical protein [Candidatus Sulfotelmatobacter sp.]
MKRSFTVLVAVFSLLFLAGFLVSDAHSQINGPPASVTSPGFGGRAVNGPPASVTSVGPHGYGNGQFMSPFNRDAFNARVHNGQVHPHHNSLAYTPFFTYAVPVPYAVDMGAADQPEDAAQAQAEDEENYQGGPTVFDRRGYGPGSYIPPHDGPPPHAAEHSKQAVDPEPVAESLEPTTLVFKDGHKLEVGNYAIIGPTLFDMTPGHARKVPLKDLDLEATRRTNDEHGVSFDIPLSSKPNQAN